MKNSGLDQLSESVCRHRRAITISACITAALLWTVVVISWGLSLVVNPEVAEESTMEEGLPSIRSIDLWPDDYQHIAFQKTLKSCDPNKNSKCMSFVPEGAKGERIAVLSPPGALGLLFENFIAQVVQLHSPHSNATNLELIRSSHVPPVSHPECFWRCVASIALTLLFSSTVMEKRMESLKLFDSSPCLYG
jgi:hypothetical protein